jgi:hypothetical protein
VSIEGEKATDINKVVPSSGSLQVRIGKKEFVVVKIT